MDDKVELAPPGSILADFQKERTEAFDEMITNMDDQDLYSTTKFYVRLDKAVEEALRKQREFYGIK